MSDWPTGFIYRIELDLTPFMIAGFLALAVAWIIVGGHAVRVARANPIGALRYE